MNVKRMGLALDGLIRSEYPGDFLQFIEMYTFAKPRHVSEIPNLMPKPVTIYNPVVRLKADMSDPNISELQLPPHFTNIQHAMQLGRKFLANQDTPNRQMVLITDGLPTAHFEGNMLYLLYPPDQAHRRRDHARSALVCSRGNHDQHLPVAELEPVGRRRPLRLSHGGDNQGPRDLHSGQRSGSVCGLGLCEEEEVDCGVGVLRSEGLKSRLEGTGSEPALCED